jgi:hypothetical protein
MRMSVQIGFIASMSLVSLSLGCGNSSGPTLGTVTGLITVNGEPLTGANVIFVPKDNGSPSYGATDEEGVYRLMFNQHRAGAELGQHSVLIEYPEPETDDSGKRIRARPIVKLPEKYRQPGTLTADVNVGRNIVDFTLR